MLATPGADELKIIAAILERPRDSVNRTVAQRPSHQDCVRPYSSRVRPPA